VEEERGLLRRGMVVAIRGYEGLFEAARLRVALGRLRKVPST